MRILWFSPLFAVVLGLSAALPIIAKR